MGLFDFITGGQDEYYQPRAFQSQADSDINKMLTAYNRGDITNLLNRYGMGDASLGQYLAGVPQNYQTEARSMLATDPLTASRLAAEQVQSNPLLGQLYGGEGALTRALSEEQQLAQRGYSLQPEDYEAYGQASDDLARMFGAQEQGLAQSLAARGLGGAQSGAAIQNFAGMYGNKAEQLARAQKDIAQRRMETNLQRLGQTRNYAMGLGQGAQQALRDQYNMQQQGANRRLGIAESQRNADISRFMGEEGLRQASMQDKRAAQSPGLFGAIQSGILSGVQGGISGAIGGGIGSAFSGGPSDLDRAKTAYYERMSQSPGTYGPSAAYKGP